MGTPLALHHEVSLPSGLERQWGHPALPPLCAPLGSMAARVMSPEHSFHRDATWMGSHPIFYGIVLVKLQGLQSYHLTTNKRVLTLTLTMTADVCAASHVSQNSVTRLLSFAY